MARNPARPGFAKRIIHSEEQVRQLRVRGPADVSYTLVDDDFIGQTISGTYYGWQQSAFSVPLQLTRYGNLIVCTGRFKRLWTADGSTPGGWSDSSHGFSIFRQSGSTIPDELTPLNAGVVVHYPVPIYYWIGSGQEDVGNLVFSGNFGGGGLEIALAHVDGSYAGSVNKVPFRRTVELFVNFTVPYQS